MIEALVVIALLVSIVSGVFYLIGCMPVSEDDFDEFYLYH
jgi:hypothetical protein